MRRLASPPGWRLARILLALLLACARSIAPARAQTSPASGFAFAPPVAPVLTHTSGPGAEVASTYFFDDFRRYHYVSTRVTTPDNVASGASQLIFQWGEVAHTCGGLIAFITGSGTLVFSVNCNTDSDPGQDAYDNNGQLSPNTDYLLEFYYDAKEHVAKIWVNGTLESDAITGELGFNWNDGPISVGMLHGGAAPLSSSGTIHEVSFYEWGDARGFAPTCAPVLRHKDGAGSSVRSSHTFDSANKYVYVAARITTGASFSTNGRIFLWGADAQCGPTDAGGGLQAYIALTSGKQAFGVQCSTGSDSPVLETGPGMLTNTEYFLEWMYDTSTGVVKMWRDGELRAEIAGNFNYVDGKLTVGNGHHTDSTVQPFEGTIHDISFYECPRGGSVFADRDALKAEVDACLAEEPLGRRCGMETWDVSAVTSLANVFDNAASFDADISGWDVSSVTTMARTFASATFFNGRLDNWDVSKVTDMFSAFFGTKWFNQPIGNWDVSSVKYMRAMFSEANFNQPIGLWDVSSVEDMASMFDHNRAFNQPIGRWHTCNVEMTDNMFRGATAFNQPIGNWISNGFKHIQNMFEGASAFNHDITVWIYHPHYREDDLQLTGHIHNRNHGQMFLDAGAWHTLYNHWAGGTSDGPPMDWSRVESFCGENERVSSGACVPCAAGYVRAPGDASAGEDTECFECAEDFHVSSGTCVACASGTFNPRRDVATGADTQCRERLCPRNHRVFAGSCEPCAAGYANSRRDGTAGGDTTCGECTKHYHVSSGACVACPAGFLNAAGDDATGPDTTCDAIVHTRVFTTLQDLKNAVAACADPCDEATYWDVSQLTSLLEAFRDRSGFNGDISGWDTSKVTDMQMAFRGASAFNQPIGRWDLSNVRETSWMFYDAKAFNQPIGDWNVSTSMSMYRTFTGARSFNQPIGNWDTSGVESFHHMFDLAVRFNQPIGNWDTSSRPISMDGMFFRALSFNQPIGRWDVSGVVSMYAMFRDAASFDQYIGDWPTGAVETMHGMFQRTRRFNQALGDWDTGKVTDTGWMFELALAFNHDITGWTDVTTDSTAMFNFASAWNAIYTRDSGINGPASAWSLESQYCGEDERVSAGACVACPSGYHNAPGDDKNGGVDTACGECAVDHRVSSGACVPCEGYRAYNDRRDRLADGDTTCYDTLLCASGERVSRHACEPCPPGTTNPAGDDPRGGDTTCGCEDNHRVAAGACVPCPEGHTRVAGDDMRGGDTECCELTSCCAAGMLKGGFTLPDRCRAVAASPPPSLAPSPSSPTSENPALFSDYVVKLDAATLYSGNDAVNAATNTPWTMMGGAACARNRYRGVDVFDLDVPACHLETTERINFCGPTFGWTTAEWIDWRDASNVGEGYRTHHRASNGGAEAGTHILITGQWTTQLGAHVQDGAATGWTPASPAYDIPVAGWHLVVAVGQDEDCVAGGGTTRYYVGDPGSPPRLVGAIDVSVGSGNMQTFKFGWQNQGPGKLAEAWVWNYALSDDDLEALWRGTVQRFGPP